MFKKMIKKLIVTTLVSSLLLSMPLTAIKAATSVGSDEIVKDENIYAVLKPDGQVNNIYVVNSFELGSEAMITDYGDYESLRNLSNTKDLIIQDKKITGSAPKGRFYYQGNLASKDLPWKMEIGYKLDNQEIDPTELIGKSGNVAISIKVTQNEKVSKDFFEHYSMQISVNLDGDKFYNIIAEEATIANAGNNKNLNFTLLPGNEKTFIIKADVQNFELKPIQFSGVLLSMEINPEGTDTLTDDFEPLKDGIGQLNDGAGKLEDGSKDYAKGMNTLADNTEKIAKSSSSIDTAISNTSKGLSDLIHGTQQLKELANAMLSSQDMQTKALAQGYLSQIQALEQIAGGTSALSEQYTQFDSGLQQLSDGMQSLKNGYKGIDNGIDKLSEGTQELYDNTSDMDTKMQDKIDSMLSEFSNEDFKPQSFVSENNKNIGTVQFIIRTDSLEVPEVKTTEEVEKAPLTFWQKFLKLFGMYKEVE